MNANGNENCTKSSINSSEEVDLVPGWFTGKIHRKGPAIASFLIELPATLQKKEPHRRRFLMHFMDSFGTAISAIIALPCQNYCFPEYLLEIAPYKLWIINIRFCQKGFQLAGKLSVTKKIMEEEGQYENKSFSKIHTKWIWKSKRHARFWE